MLSQKSIWHKSEGGAGMQVIRIRRGSGYIQEGGTIDRCLSGILIGYLKNKKKSSSGDVSLQKV